MFLKVGDIERSALIVSVCVCVCKSFKTFSFYCFRVGSRRCAGYCDIRKVREKRNGGDRDRERQRQTEKERQREKDRKGETDRQRQTNRVREGESER